mmetsp:Transcript_7061/g.18164  ORF Transcript_7061/g.18164 Transcript_7061/m.18164 type:complete len:461 (-) Transcript_7061:1671-3053(-)
MRLAPLREEHEGKYQPDGRSEEVGRQTSLDRTPIRSQVAFGRRVLASHASSSSVFSNGEKRPLSHNPAVSRTSHNPKMPPRRGATTAPSMPRGTHERGQIHPPPPQSSRSPPSSPSHEARPLPLHSHDEDSIHGFADSAYEIPSVLQRRQKRQEKVRVSSRVLKELPTDANGGLHRRGNRLAEENFIDDDDYLVMSALKIDSGRALSEFSPPAVKEYDWREYAKGDDVALARNPSEATSKHIHADEECASPDHRLRSKLQPVVSPLLPSSITNAVVDSALLAESEDGVLMRPTTAETARDDEEAVGSLVPGIDIKKDPPQEWTHDNSANAFSPQSLRYPKDLFSPSKEERAFTPPLMVGKKKGLSLAPSPGKHLRDSPLAPSISALAENTSGKPIESNPVLPISISSAGREALIVGDRRHARMQTGEGSSESEEDALELVFDPILQCYYDPETNRYYELK